MMHVERHIHFEGKYLKYEFNYWSDSNHNNNAHVKVNQSQK